MNLKFLKGNYYLSKCQNSIENNDKDDLNDIGIRVKDNENLWIVLSSKMDLPIKKFKLIEKDLFKIGRLFFKIFEVYILKFTEKIIKFLINLNPFFSYFTNLKLKIITNFSSTIIIDLSYILFLNLN